MLSSHALNSLDHSRDQKGSSSGGYVPNGQPDFQIVNQYHPYQPQYNNYGLAVQSHMVAMHTYGGGGDGGNGFTLQWGQLQPPQRYTSSNNRDQRNKAEKMRRDKLNALISEMAKLIPIVNRSPKRLDKTSILRLTATTLRIYHTLIKGRSLPELEIPKYVDQFLLDQLMCDDMNGFLLIVTTSGKIIFVSHTIETLLGHSQAELMGQTLYSITAPDNHDKLQLYLRSEGELGKLWKKDFSINMRKGGPKSEPIQYESVRMVGMPKNMSTDDVTGTSIAVANGGMSPSNSTAVMQNTLNTQVLVFFVRVNRPHPLAERLVATSKDEYVTRHLIDGRIVACDHRISLIAGYMTDEVTGSSGFQYMHKDDVRFAMIALRQMYDKGETRGGSCYRLRGANGEFIYLKTFGMLEIDERGIVESFLCVNVLMDEREGRYRIEDMKKRYAAFFRSSLSQLPYEKTDSPSASYGDSVSLVNTSSESASQPQITDGTEDPVILDEAINELMQNLPTPVEDPRNGRVDEQRNCADTRSDSDSTETITFRCNGGTSPSNGNTSPYNGSTSSYNSNTPSYNGNTPPYNGNTSSYNVNTPHYNGNTPPYNGNTPYYTGDKSSYNGKTLAVLNNARLSTYSNKRALSNSPETVKRQRLTSNDFDPMQYVGPPAISPKPLKPFFARSPELEASFLSMQQLDDPCEVLNTNFLSKVLNRGK